jgi:hypothetical protein
MTDQPFDVDEVVEAAAQALAVERNPSRSWADLSERQKGRDRRAAKAAVNAALPLIIGGSVQWSQRNP